MGSEDIVMFLYNDLSGVCRGRGFPASDLDERLAGGVGWVPADQALTPTGQIADPNPWGSMGDLRLRADPDTQVRVDLGEDASPLHFYLCDAVNPDMTPWDACVRDFCKQALADLEAEFGLRLLVAFEQEFHLDLFGSPLRAATPFSMDAYRSVDPLGPRVVAALVDAGRPVETFLPEYGSRQYEVNLRPAWGLTGADNAAVVREVVRDVARHLGYRASFAPMFDPDDSGSGVHIHLSLWDADGSPVTHAADGPGGLSPQAGAFAAGIVRHLPALCALTAPSPISYLRLTPHRWSAAYTVLGERNREAAVRIYPGGGPGDVAAQFNLEYRPADAAASPHLALGAVVRAGLEGLRDDVEVPPLVNVDPSELSDDERQRLGAQRLPDRLSAALDALEADDVVRGWFSKDLWDCYVSLKRTELDLTDGVEPRELCERYLGVY